MNKNNHTSFSKPKDVKTSIKKTLKYSKKLLPFLIISIISAIFSSIFSIIAPNYLTELVNNISKGLISGINFDAIYKISKTLILIYILSALFNLIEGIISATVANKLSKNLRTSITQKINKLPLNYFDEHSYGDILSRITNDVDILGQSINQSLGSFIVSITLIIGSLIMMFYTNYIMAFTAIISSLIGFTLMSLILSKSQIYFIKRQEELGKMNGHIEEIYSNYNIVKTYNGSKQAIKEFDELNNNLFTCNLKSQFISGLMHPLMGFIGNIAYVAVCIVGALLTMKGIISFGVIIGFIVYVRLFNSPLSQIAQGLTSLQSAAAAAERVFEFLEEKEMTDESNKTKYIKLKDAKGKVEFNNIKFSYETNNPIIKDFNLKINPGDKIAIVGPTGAGKTTIVNLLMKFYEINDGDILIDDISINDLTRENIHELFTMVLQDTWLFKGTLKENIIYNQINIKDKEVIDVLNKVGLSHLMKTLPNGLETIIDENDNISAGERQLITIARGMIKNSPLLILDEATSNVDTRTEVLVQKAMDKITEGKTSFIIAHRLSTIKNADKIIVMDKGKIIEIGNHKELIERNGFYKKLYNSQFQI